MAKTAMMMVKYLFFRDVSVFPRKSREKNDSFAFSDGIKRGDAVAEVSHGTLCQTG